MNPYQSSLEARRVEVLAGLPWLTLALEARDLAAGCAADPAAYAGAYRAVLLRLLRLVQGELSRLPALPPARAADPPPPERPAGYTPKGSGA